MAPKFTWMLLRLAPMVLRLPLMELRLALIGLRLIWMVQRLAPMVLRLPLMFLHAVKQLAETDADQIRDKRQNIYYYSLVSLFYKIYENKK